MHSTNKLRSSPARQLLSNNANPPQPLNLFQYVYQSVATGTAIICGLGLMILLFLLYACIRPFSRRLYRRLAAHLGSSSFLDAMALILPNCRICLTPDSDIISPIGTSLLVSNHSLEGFDWWVMLMFGRCINLRGSIRIFLKKNGAKLCENLQAPILKFLFQMLEYPLLPSVHGKDYVQDREGLFELLRGFAEESIGGWTAGNNVAVFLLFPEGTDRNIDMAEFARREGRPILKHLLLPRTTGFSASLESLRSSSPIVYDVTIAYKGYDGKVIAPCERNQLATLWLLITGEIPEVHVRIKRNSMEDVLQDSQWLDKCWVEKDRLLEHFYRHQCFPRAGPNKCRVFDTRFHSVENSILGMFRLLLMPCLVPLILLISIPLAWTVAWLWFAYQLFFQIFGGFDDTLAQNNNSREQGDGGAVTPFVPATPFVSPMTQRI